ncbi:DUF6461 domain-containing protein [Saccharothrix violaceirubra]|uniref:Uncharacterized protein n=1 Tax=Saccharothrix violaceirubra TaxID=413306 RepID=A0A7W7T0K9_9PSEU|nr:DUF6461 domain-containing protein [Saccharothrix violaceirubra]MBB4964387.1 hypothetical protein [Saccharothrix violaceirubra]
MGDYDTFATTVATLIRPLADSLPAAVAADLARLPATRRRSLDDVLRLPSLADKRVLDGVDPPLLVPPVDPPPPLRGSFMTMGWVGESPLATESRLADTLRPGTGDLAEDLVVRLADHPDVASALAVPELDDLDVLDGRHGARHIALALLVTKSILGEDATRPAVLGIALDVVARVLPGRPKPARHADAVLARRRADYRFPAYGSRHVPTPDHWFALTPGPVEAVPDFSANGLVAVLPEGIAVRVASDEVVLVGVDVTATPPEADLSGWEEIVEVSFHTDTGDLGVAGWPVTPPWPGDLRFRVHASGRDGDHREYFRVQVWEAPLAPEKVVKRTDRLGHVLRGETPPDTPSAEHRPYLWVEESVLSVAATITVVTGASVDHVVASFDGRREDHSARDALEGYGGAILLDIGDTVFIVEINGYWGSWERYLGPASAHGRAASAFWNVNGSRRLSFAERGRLLGSFEPPFDDVPAAVAEWCDGLDLADYRSADAKMLAALARFTGHGFVRADYEALTKHGVAYILGDD